MLDKIPEEILQKYEMKSIDYYKMVYSDEPDIEELYYKDFLELTDHIPNKIVESKELGLTVKDYYILLECRQFARDRINEILRSV